VAFGRQELRDLVDAARTAATEWTRRVVDGLPYLESMFAHSTLRYRQKKFAPPPRRNRAFPDCRSHGSHYHGICSVGAIAKILFHGEQSRVPREHRPLRAQKREALSRPAHLSAARKPGLPGLRVKVSISGRTRDRW